MKSTELLARMADVIRPRAPGERAKAAAVEQPLRKLIFFADNSRLRPDNEDIRNAVEAKCARYGLAAEWPSEHFLFPTGLTAAERERGSAALRPINRDVERLLPKAWRKLTGCDAIVAEITPFRGPHMSPVIAFEIGVAVAWGIPVFAWTASTIQTRWAPPGCRLRFRAMLERVRLWAGAELSPDGNWRDDDEHLIENFDAAEPAAIAGNLVSLDASRDGALAAASLYFERRRGAGASLSTVGA